MTTTFVLTIGERPIATTDNLETAQAEALAAETRDQSEPREHRWDLATTWQTSNGRVWQLMVRSPRTNRWNKTLRSVIEVPILPSV